MFEGIDITPITLVDRLGGGCEILFDGRRYPVPRETAEVRLPRVIVEWLFSVDQHKVNTPAGYVCRFGIKDGPNDLADSLGPESLDCTPIERDAYALEGWDWRSTDRGRVQAMPINIPPSELRENLASADVSTARR